MRSLAGSINPFAGPQSALSAYPVNAAGPPRVQWRSLLPDATIVVDHPYLVKLANDALTRVRCRVTWDVRDRLGRRFDAGWTKTFKDPRLCAPIVDRLTFGGNIIETGTDSYRLAHTKAAQNQT
jgi:hypothetical protein